MAIQRGVAGHDLPTKALCDVMITIAAYAEHCVAKAVREKDAEIERLREAIEAIRCNTELNTLGQVCDLPKETAPHTEAEHLKSQIRAVNAFCRVAIQEGE